jgi:glycosyltransferase involved in cell wall biosynthesis
VLEQSFCDIEIIVLDDASTDDSLAVLQEFVTNERIHSSLNEKNSGSPFKQWRKGAELATGEYLWIAESDDWADVEFVTHLLAILENNTNVGLAYCQSLIVDENDQILGSRLAWTNDLDPKLWTNDFVFNGQSFCAKYMLSKNVIPNASAVLIRKSMWDQVGGVDDDMRLCGDWLLWIKILQESDIGYCSLPLNYYRIHFHTARNLVTKGLEDVEERYRIFQYLQENFSIPDKSKRKRLEELCLLWVDRILSANNLSIQERARLLQNTYQSMEKYDPHLGLRFGKYFALHPVYRLYRYLKG